jgi:hypothetical protein
VEVRRCLSGEVWSLGVDFIGPIQTRVERK